MALDPTFSIRMDLTGLKNASQKVKDAAALRDSQQMQDAISQALLEMVLVAQKERFSGQGPYPMADQKLGVVSGRLRRDLHAEPAEKTATGYQGKIGSIVEYFGIHEFGFDGEVSVKEHSRKAATLTKPGPFRDTAKGRLLSVRQKSLLFRAKTIKAHKRKLKIEARQPLRAALAQHSRRIIVGAIGRVFDGAMDGKQKGLS